MCGLFGEFRVEHSLTDRHSPSVCVPMHVITLSCSKDNLVQVYSILTGQKVAQHSGHGKPKPVMAVCFHPTEPFVYSGGRDKVRWDIERLFWGDLMASVV